MPDWPDGGPWVLVPTSAAVDWRAAATALAAASSVRVAAVALGAGGPPGETLPAHLATWMELRDGEADPLSVDEAAGLVSALARTHGLVLILGVPGLLVPVGRAGWTIAELAVALGAPVLVAADGSPDAMNHTTLALGVLDARGLTGAVLMVGAAAPADGLPVEPAGQIPDAGLGDADIGSADIGPADIGDEARAWLNPMLHASAGLRKTAAPAPPPAPPPTTARTTSGKRVILSLGGLFVAMCVAATGLAFCDRSAQRNTGTAVLTAEASAVVRDPRASAAGRVAPIPTAPAPAPAPSPACTQFRLDGAPARPDAATGKRVGAAWLRIEKWLAAKAPASSRSLKPPARAADIDLAQRRMSVRFPADLVASLLRHNGAAGGGFTLPFMHRPMTVAEIPAQWWMLCGIVTDSPGLRGYWWDSGFVPFADAGDGGSLVADQRPGNHGRVGEFFDENGVSFETWPASVAELLERTATSLETGKPFAGRFRPVVTGGRLAWDVV